MRLLEEAVNRYGDIMELADLKDGLDADAPHPVDYSWDNPIGLVVREGRLKKLGGVNAVQTLSRLNRTHPGKEETTVLDFANEAEHIRAAFEPYYDTTLLSEGTGPNLLYDIQGELRDFDVYSEAEVDAFAGAYFGRHATQDQLYSRLGAVVDRFRALDADARSDFRGRGSTTASTRS